MTLHIKWRLYTSIIIAIIIALVTTALFIYPGDYTPSYGSPVFGVKLQLIYVNHVVKVRVYSERDCSLGFYREHCFRLFSIDGRSIDDNSVDDNSKDSFHSSTEMFLDKVQYYEFPCQPPITEDNVSLEKDLSVGIFARTEVFDPKSRYNSAFAYSNVLQVFNPNLSNDPQQDSVVTDKSAVGITPIPVKTEVPFVDNRIWGNVVAGARSSLQNILFVPDPLDPTIRMLVVSATIKNISQNTVSLNTTSLYYSTDVNEPYKPMNSYLLFERNRSTLADSFLRPGNEDTVDLKLDFLEFSKDHISKVIRIGTPIVQADGTSVIVWSNSAPIPDLK